LSTYPGTSCGLALQISGVRACVCVCVCARVRVYVCDRLSLWWWWWWEGKAGTLKLVVKELAP